MKAARIYEFKKPFVIEDAPFPEIKSDEGVIVNVAGAGLCHTDISYMDGLLPDVRGKVAKFPYIMGHESSGYVYKVGDGVAGFHEGDPVLVYGAVGCGMCEFCKKGEENRCSVNPMTIGLSPEYEGGFAEFMYVPTYRNLVKVSGDPTDLAPLTDAGLTAYRAAKKVRSHLDPGTYALVFGVGGLGTYAIQYMKLFGAGSIIAIDTNDSKLEFALKLGADHALKFDSESIVEHVRGITGGRPVKAALDFVGINATANAAVKLISGDGIYVDIGLGGGTLSVPVIDLIHGELLITGNMWGTFNELRETYELVKSGKVNSILTRRKLEEINSVVSDMRNGRIVGRAVLTP
ncbi:MAG: NAD(P)-dependent alcohol dehydrogenase [Nitrososphaerota archaeon]|jgi:D-arabinose 1-dehydrogenase-like Zn-dependent alcohol dehydrogenase|nr:NAD(P)-dependent alcohol dehydrogenase [Nitrososphaerota archaeon]MDG6935397.1 NAD(P)-dependent alcohol dehydrogenase [Nitrososphaerota archaeon]